MRVALARSRGRLNAARLIAAIALSTSIMAGCPSCSLVERTPRRRSRSPFHSTQTSPRGPTRRGACGASSLGGHKPTLSERLTRQRRDRLGLALRALDGRLSGESYRVIAQSLFRPARIPAGAAWKTHELRDRTIRLARVGLKLMRGGYLELLRYPRKQPE